MTSPGRDHEPIFEAEKAPPTVWEQLKVAFRPRGKIIVADRPGVGGVLLGIGKALLGSIGGVLLMLGILGVAMTVLLGLYVLISLFGSVDIGFHWAVVPMSLVLFGVIGGIGVLILRSMGMFTRSSRAKRSRQPGSRPAGGTGPARS